MSFGVGDHRHRIAAGQLLPGHQGLATQLLCLCDGTVDVCDSNIERGPARPRAHVAPHTATDTVALLVDEPIVRGCLNIELPAEHLAVETTQFVSILTHHFEPYHWCAHLSLLLGWAVLPVCNGVPVDPHRRGADATRCTLHTCC